MVDKNIALGPGKVDLLEAINVEGSISGAARKNGLSYRRAWDMVDMMNGCFKSPLIERKKGGKGGGGALLTPLGEEVVRLYREMEKQAQQSIESHWKTLRKAINKTS